MAKRLLWAALAATGAAFELVAFTYSAGEGLLTLTFDGAVQSRTLNASCLVLQSNATAERAPLERHRLRGAHPTLGQFLYDTPYNTSETLTLVMRDDDLLQVQAYAALGIDAKSMFLAVDEGVARAVADNQRASEIPRSKPLPVDTYVPDTLQSEMELYTIDMHAGLINFKFLEPVARASLDLSGVILQTDVNVLSVDGGYECRNVDPDACVQLSLVNTEAKLLDVPCVDTNVSSTNNSVTTWTLQCLNTTTVEDALWLNISLGPTNLNAIKAHYPLGSQEHLTNLALRSPIASDRGGNAFLTINLMPEMALEPASWIGDRNRPLLTSFNVDMDAGTIALTFNETVNANELDVTCVSLHETQDNRTGGLVHYLRSYGPQGARTDGTLVATGDGPTLVLQMSREDSDEIKRKPRLLISKETSYVALDCDEVYRDNAFPVNFGIRRSRVDALQALAYVPDTTRPVLTSASLDLDVKVLTLEFDETVNASSLDIDLLQVQSTERDLSYTERVQLQSYEEAGDIRHDRLSRRGSGRTSPSGSNISIAIGDRDFAAMKLATTFGSLDSTFVAALGGAILDMNGNKLTEVPISKAVGATNGVVADKTQPSLDKFALDLDSGTFALKFDEPVTRSSLDVTKCALAALDTEDAERVVFTNTHVFLEADDIDAVRARRLLMLDFEPVTDAMGSEVLYVKLSQTDLNALKLAETLAVDTSSSRWLSEDAWCADSVTANPSPPVIYQSSTNFSTDVTAPLLTGGIVDLDAALFTLQADEPVRGVSANASFFRISSRADGTGHFVDVDADTVLSPATKDATALTFRLDCASLDLLKLWGPHQAFLSHTPKHYESRGGLIDMYGNALAVVNGSKNTSLPAQVVADFTAPQLVGFDFGANITLRFDEPVDPLSLRGLEDAWYLQKRSDSMSGFQSVTLASHAPPSRTVEAGLSRYALEIIGDDAQFGTVSTDTYLRPVSAGAAFDVAGNPLEQLADGLALQLGPRVLSFELDMDSGVLVLYFSEPVDTLTFSPSKFGLQAQSSILALTETLQLSSSTTVSHRTGPCEPTATLQLTPSDVEALRFMTSLSRGRAATYLTASSDAATDIDEAPYIPTNDLIAIATGTALQASNVYADATSSSFINCELDLDANLLTLKFDEPVRAASFDASRVEIRDAHLPGNATEAVTLSSSSSAGSDAYHLVVQLGDRDVYAIKQKPPLGQNRNTTYCGVRSGTVLDCGAGGMESNRNLAGVRQAIKVLPDVTAPDLVSFALDLDANALVLTFDEPVNVSSIDPVLRDVYLHAGATEEDDFVTLSCSKVPASTETWNATVAIELCQRDFNALFATPALCRRVEACYLSHVFGLAADSAAPPNSAKTRGINAALEASAILPDVTPPVVTTFGLDLDTGTLSFEFDEVVHLKTFDVSTITLQSARFNDFLGTRTLSAANGTECFYEEVNATSASVRLGRDDLDAVKALAGVGLALDIHSTFFSHAPGLVEDVSGNPASELQSYKGFAANNFTSDSTPPKLLSVQKISMTKKLLYVVFDEPVDHEGFNRGHWFLSRLEDGGRYSLGDDATVEVVDPFTEEDGGVLADDKAPYSSIMTLRLGDAYDSLPISDQAATFLALDDWAVSDTALKKQNPLLGDETVSLQYPGTGGSRATMLGPRLEAFALDMDKLAITLQFTAPILANRTALDLSKFTLQAASDASQQYAPDIPTASVTLSSSSKAYAAVKLPRTDAKLLVSQLLDAPEYPLDSDGDIAVRCALSKDDAWALQRAAQHLGKGSSNTFASFTSALGSADSDSSLVGDPMTLVGVPSDRGAPLDINAFRRDGTRPSLTSYTLDLDDGILELEFDEPVVGETMNLSSISLKNGQYWPYEAVSLTSRSSVLKSDPNGRYDACVDSAGNRSQSCDYARIALHPKDFDNLKAAKAGEYLDLERRAAADSAGNAVNELSEASSLAVGTFTKDATPPVLTSFLLDIDGDGKLHLNFSEPVDPQSWDASKVSLRSSSVPFATPAPSHDNAVPSAAPTTPVEYPLEFSTSFQAGGVTTLELRLGGDLVALKRAIAGNPLIGGIGASSSSTYLAASEGYVTDLAFPGAPNAAAAVASLAASSTVNDLTGPRLASFELDVESGTMELFFNEPIAVADFNASQLILRKNASSLSVGKAAQVRLSALSTASVIFDCQARVTLHSSDITALNEEGIGDGAALQHLGGVLKDVVGGNGALQGCGPPGGVKADSSFNFENGRAGLGPSSSLPEGPIPVEQKLDLESGTLRISFFHDVRMSKQVNLTAVTIAAADTSDAFFYRLTGGTYSIEAQYDGAGEAIILITLSKEDIDGIKLADGKDGIMPLATSVSTTVVGLDSTFIWSATFKQNVPRLVGDLLMGGVPAKEMTTDSTRPLVVSYALDMDSGTLVLEWDEPIRASESVVTLIEVRKSATATLDVMTLSTTKVKENGASSVVTFVFSADDRDELKRIDGLATNRSTAFVYFPDFTFLDRSVEENTAASSLTMVTTYVEDTTKPNLEGYSLDIEARTVTLHFDEPVLISSFNASCVTLQEDLEAINGQFHQLQDSYAVDTSLFDSSAVKDLEVAFSSFDYDAINGLSRLAKSESAVRLTLRSCAVVDVSGNSVVEIADKAARSSSSFRPDATNPELLRFTLDVDRGTLTMNFTEPVFYGYVDATKFALYSAESGGETVAMSEGTTTATLESFMREYAYDFRADEGREDYYGYGGELILVLAADDLNAVKASSIGVDAASTYLTAEVGGIGDMTGNALDATTQRKPSAGYFPDITSPSLSSFDLDLDAGVLHIEFDESVNEDTLDLSKILVTPDGSSTEGTNLVGGARRTKFWTQGVDVDRGNGTLSAQVYVDLGETNLDALKTAGVGLDGTAFLAADENAIQDMAGLPLQRVAPNDFEGGAPVKARYLTKDATGPSLVAVNFAADDLILDFDEPVVLTSAVPRLVSIVDEDGEGDPLDPLVSASQSRRGRNAKRRITLDLKKRCSADEVCRIKVLQNATNVTEASTTLVCTQPACDLEKAFAIKQRSELYVTLGAGFVRDHFGNPSQGHTRLRERDPECTCAAGSYIKEQCEDRVDVVCAPCSLACPASQYMVSACGTHADIGCLPCQSCRTPYFVSGGCSGSEDTVCAECTPCGPLDYEAAPCTAGQNRVCISCERSSECIEVTPVCENTPAKWWRKMNCCWNNDGQPLPCNTRTEANVRISKRNSRQHWVFGSTVPAVEDGFLEGDASTS